MDSGLYCDKNGKKVAVERTSSGYLVRYGDGRVVAIGMIQRSTATRSPQPFAP